MLHRFHDFPRHPPERAGQPWVMRVPVISTRHITAADNEHLRATGERGLALFPHSLEGSGHLLHLGEASEPWEPDEHLSPALNNLAAALLAKGWCYLRLSPDGAEFSDLPTFQW